MDLNLVMPAWWAASFGFTVAIPVVLRAAFHLPEPEPRPAGRHTRQPTHARQAERRGQRTGWPVANLLDHTGELTKAELSDLLSERAR